ncbi:hypothetical protein HS088_TW19G00713 [Tripterygium wilfordii]|uniref:alpha-L-fucosidase n=1 Tax=Tripterygium wilfordii TaxID=458696 RepID=A0A7J7CAD3_TRIWF|nr:hypothetical protein HS088_TW19G00713 [Tripterygium wilfordii]
MVELISDFIFPRGIGMIPDTVMTWSTMNTTSLNFKNYLTSRYGSVKEVWIDGAKGANEPYITYYFSDWFSKMKEFQSSMNIMSDAGPDLRWPGNEKGVAGSTCWSPINRTSLSIGNASVIGYQNIGDPKGTDWIPPECPVSIRPGWFWHKSESPKTLSELLGIYYTTVGRNCVMLLNVPPNSTGLFPETDVQRLKEFGSAIDTIFSTNLAETCSVKASGQRGGKGDGYGSVREIWFDGAKGSNAPNMSYYFSDWFSMVKELQSSINIFSDAGPDVRWVGNEKGFAGNTSWSTINGTSLSIGNASIEDYLNTGDPKGTDWVPAECDVSIRDGWFWHKSESPKRLSQLLEIYYNSVGRNCVMLLNVPPNSTGLISEPDVQRLKEFRSAITTTFSTNLAENCYIKASSQRGGKDGGFGPENVLDNDHLWTYWAPSDDDNDHEQWIEIRGTNGGLRFNVIRIQEAIGLGQRIKEHKIYVDGKKVADGTTVGYKRLHRLEKGLVHGQIVRIQIVKSKGLPLISSIGLHFDPFWHPKGSRDQSSLLS